MKPVTLRTERLVLSSPDASDIDAIYEACQDPLIQRFTTVPSPYQRADAEGFVELVASWWEAVTETTWAIRHEGELVGMVGLHRLGKGDGEIGYWMAPSARGRGLLTEASTAVIDWALSTDGLGLARIEWRAVAENTASARVAQRLGFRFEGSSRAALVTGDAKRHDALIAGLLASDDRAPQPWTVLD